MQLWIAFQENMSLTVIIVGACLMLSTMSMIFTFSAIVIANKTDRVAGESEGPKTSGGNSHLAPSNKSAHLIH
jgi:hypothetical protein